MSRKNLVAMQAP